MAAPTPPYTPTTVDQQCVGCDRADRPVVTTLHGEPCCADCVCPDGCEQFHDLGAPCPVVEFEPYDQNR
jgi:hypothetical protein